MEMVETELKLTHVSRDFFTAELKVFHYAKVPSAICRVEFQVDVKGVPKFGAELNFVSDSSKGMVWFERSSKGA